MKSSVRARFNKQTYKYMNAMFVARGSSDMCELILRDGHDRTTDNQTRSQSGRHNGSRAEILIETSTKPLVHRSIQSVSAFGRRSQLNENAKWKLLFPLYAAARFACLVYRLRPQGAQSRRTLPTNTHTHTNIPPYARLCINCVSIIATIPHHSVVQWGFAYVLGRRWRCIGRS